MGQQHGHRRWLAPRSGVDRPHDTLPTFPMVLFTISNLTLVDDMVVWDGHLRTLGVKIAPRGRNSSENENHESSRSSKDNELQRSRCKNTHMAPVITHNPLALAVALHLILGNPARLVNWLTAEVVAFGFPPPKRPFIARNINTSVVPYNSRLVRD